jgi:hypothetical protein
MDQDLYHEPRSGGVDYYRGDDVAHPASWFASDSPAASSHASVHFL